MSDNQEYNNEVKKGVIDSYDGDPDEQVFFQSPVRDEMQTEYRQQGDSTGDIVVESKREEEEPEEFYRVVPVDLEQETASQSGQEDTEFVVTPIDPNDPHYANYTPDPYYDYGYGPEPKAKKVDDKKDGSSLGVVSLSTGIAANVLCCCGLNYLCSLAAIITGIICLCTKNISTSARVMAIIGIILGLLPFLLLIFNLVLNMIGAMTLPYTYRITP